MKEIDYRDQSPHCSRFADRRIDSIYTEHGIKCIDTQFGIRIRNIHNKIIRITQISIERMLAGEVGWHEETKKWRASGMKAEVTIDDFINNKWGGWGNELRITWDNGDTYEFFYWDNVLVIDPNTGKEDPKILRKHIRKNKHLHKDIKNNLILNLNNYLKVI